jgi:hypothetical protein
VLGRLQEGICGIMLVFEYIGLTDCSSLVLSVCAFFLPLSCLHEKHMPLSSILTDMISVLFFLLLLVPFATAQSPSSFENPPTGTNPNDFSFNPVWFQGDTQLVEWFTLYANYNISIWQESIPGGGATQGPGIFGKKLGNKS